MIQSTRQIKSRIRSVENTKKLTRAMEMISVSKLKRTQNALEKANPYFLKLDSLLKNILTDSETINHPIFEKRDKIDHITVCLITSDTGLCGSYNNNLIKTAENFLKKFETSKLNLITVGKKSFSYFKNKGFNIPYSFLGFNGRFSKNLADKVINTLINSFLSKESDEVYLIYTMVETAARHKVVIDKFLNLEFSGKKSSDYIFEPNRNEVLEELIPIFLTNKIKIVLLNSFVSEHQARAIAMGEATKNAVELEEALILLRNKVRQANITREILEIISSAEALKG